MSAKRDYLRFGQRLRELRAARSFTLKDVAEASREVTTDRSGRISHPYLSQLESGRPTAVSLPKLETLAALYGVRVEQIISEAPERLRKSLTAEMTRWRREGRPVPLPVFRLPKLTREIDRHVDEILAPLTRSARVPLHDEIWARRAIRDVIVLSAAPPFLDSNAQRILPAFWDLCGHRFDARDFPDTQTWLWYHVIDEFAQWLLYDHRGADELLSVVSSWTIDFGETPSSYDAALVSCSFNDPEHQRRYGYQRVPRVAVSAVRWRQTAWILYRHNPPKPLSPSPPPEPIDGIRQYFCRVVAPGSFDGLDDNTKPAQVIAQIADFAKRVPALAIYRPKLDIRVQEAVAELFNRAIEDSASKHRAQDRRGARPGR